MISNELDGLGTIGGGVRSSSPPRTAGIRPENDGQAMGVPPIVTAAVSIASLISSADWNRRVGSFSIARSTTASTASGISGTCVLGVGGTCCMCASSTEIPAPSNGSRPHSRRYMTTPRL